MTCVIALVLAAPLTVIAAVPRGAEVELRARVTDGVEHLRIETLGSEVNVAQIDADAPVALRVVQARGLERTSTLCARVDCIVAINGDFYRSGKPVGAVITAGEIIRSPHPTRPALLVERDGDVRAGRAKLTGTLSSATGLTVSVSGVNVARPRNGMVVFTPARGKRTRTTASGVEAIVRITKPATKLVAGQTMRVTLVKLAKRNSAIPRNGLVLSARGKAATALKKLWSQTREAHLTVDVGDATAQAIGGYPVLLRDGRSVVGKYKSSFARSRHPRTLVGWNAAGDLWMVTVDGRAPGRSRGMTLAEAAKLMRRLGATEAMNLDGGGSSTFVIDGTVANLPSDLAKSGSGASATVHHVERRVTNALVLVPARAAKVATIVAAPKLKPAPVAKRTAVAARPAVARRAIPTTKAVPVAFVSRAASRANDAGFELALAALATLALIRVRRTRVVRAQGAHESRAPRPARVA